MLDISTNTRTSSGQHAAACASFVHGALVAMVGWMKLAFKETIMKSEKRGGRWRVGVTVSASVCVCEREKRPERDREMKRQRKRQEGEVITRPTEIQRERARARTRAGRDGERRREKRRSDVTLRTQSTDHQLASGADAQAGSLSTAHQQAPAE